MKCSQCKNNAIVFLPYSSKHLCEQHFIRMFDKRFRKTIRLFSMLRKGDRIAVGLSGGKDSCVLLHSLHQLQKDLPFEMIAITIDEGIKGYRAKTLDIAKKQCEILGIEHRVFTFKEVAGKTLDQIEKDDEDKLPCSFCGVIRRYMLNKGAREVGANKLAIGHNLDDVAQTVLMNIMRNEPARLARFNEPIVSDKKFIPRIKPLMLTPEKENAIYAMMKGIELERVECPYAHFAFRSHVRKMLNESEERYPGTKFKIVNSFLEIEDALRNKYGKTASELGVCPTCGEASSKGICMFCKMIS
ncbi:tRNA 2-thiocytidine biosynthesis protein TtcA [Candidatus Bilamarchaeum dharawalense]|uniref:tRNA 2-thiocytidine biosynthesis protein TtcA n=1 Tax=Candidatus Bilamarchaeum dharawalense TaxID=2885759 RepID=A0A5E4LS48_9ARCH|nr:tRNA 2-thiocytidine biosynthesis protein TtcA [Candidatus Bilamarchaeum dharawalense]